MENQKKVSIELDINELNFVLQCLGKQPYDTVFTLVDKIAKQAGPQVNSDSNPQE